LRFRLQRLGEPLDSRQPPVPLGRHSSHRLGGIVKSLGLYGVAINQSPRTLICSGSVITPQTTSAGAWIRISLSIG